MKPKKKEGLISFMEERHFFEKFLHYIKSKKCRRKYKFFLLIGFEN